MPSVLLGVPPASGAQLVVSGNLFSGSVLRNGLQLRWAPNASGNCYVALSGGGPPLSGGFMTVNSGAGIPAGACSGMLDGMLLAPGDRYYIPPAELGNQGGVASGAFNVFVICDVAASGQGRLYFEPWNGFKN